MRNERRTPGSVEGAPETAGRKIRMALGPHSYKGAAPDFRSWRCRTLKTKGLEARFANLLFWVAKNCGIEAESKGSKLLYSL